MNSRTEARIVAAFVIVVLIMLWAGHIANSYQEMGREAFLAAQALRFDKYYAKDSSTGHSIGFLVAGAVFFGAILGAYELLARGIYALTTRKPKGAA